MVVLAVCTYIVHIEYDEKHGTLNLLKKNQISVNN